MSSKKTYNEKYRESRQKKSLSEIFESKKDDGIKSKKKKPKDKSKSKTKVKEPVIQKITLDYDFEKLASKKDLGILQKEIRNIRSEFILYLIIAALIQTALVYAIFKFLI